MSNTNNSRLLLRAEVTHKGRPIVGYTLEISPDSALIQTNAVAFMGDQVSVALSFPGLVDRLELNGHVISHRLSSGPGEPGGWVVGFVFKRMQDRESLQELLNRINAQEDGEGTYEEDINDPDQPYRVLLVEDSQMTREVFSFGMERYFEGKESAVRLDTAADGESAWSMLTSESYNLVIVDYFLPSLMGDELISRLRSEPEFKELPVVAMSVGGEDARDATMKAGADFFIDKPLVLSDLFSTLDRLTTLRK